MNHAKTYLDYHRQFQIKLGFTPNWVVKTLPCEKYLALIMRLVRVCGFFMKFQSCLPNIVRWNEWRLRKPIPPYSFLRHKISYFIQLIYVSPLGFIPYQNELIILLSSLHRETSNRNKAMQKVGIAWVIVLRRTSFLDWDRILACHPWSLFHILSRR